MKPRSRLLILDANIVIYLHEIGAWSAFMERYEIHLSRTVAEIEVKFFRSGEDLPPIDLIPDIDAGRIRVVDIPKAEVTHFLQRFDSLYLADLHAGESESLAYLTAVTEDFRICSADKIVFKVLPHLGCAEQGTSLEELLREAGLGRRLPHLYTQDFRVRWTQAGQQDAVTGLGRPR